MAGGAPGPNAEQALLGVQHNGLVSAPTPPVIAAADRWFWAGCSVTIGDARTQTGTTNLFDRMLNSRPDKHSGMRHVQP